LRNESSWHVVTLAQQLSTCGCCYPGGAHWTGWCSLQSYSQLLEHRNLSHWMHRHNFVRLSGYTVKSYGVPRFIAAQPLLCNSLSALHISCLCPKTRLLCRSPVCNRNRVHSSTSTASKCVPLRRSSNRDLPRNSVHFYSESTAALRCGRSLIS
jgi:hypothetical protein